MSVIFLDRDGVIIKFPGVGKYVTRDEDFQFAPGSLDALCKLTAAGFETLVVSNQGCISKGMLTHEKLNEMTHRMIKDVERGGGKIAGVFYCPHQTSDLCDCKKPQTKLFYEALRGRSVDLADIYLIGDSREDMEAGKNLGCRTILVLSGRTQKEGIDALGVKPDFVKDSLLDAVTWILQKKS